MSVNHDVPGIAVFGKGQASYTLPCGYVDENGKVHNEIIMREMTGVEEDVMDDDNLSVTDRITKILSLCCVKLGDIDDAEIIKKAVGDTLERGLPLSAADRVAMLLFLRRTSVGDVYKFERKCPYCGHLNRNRTLNLERDVVISQVTSPGKRRVKVTLPSGKIAMLKVLSASGEKQISTLKPTQKDVRTLAILARLVELDGQKMTPFHIDLIKSLSIADRNYIREVYNFIEGAVDTDVEVDCSSCNTTFEFPLDLGQVFFSNRAKKVTAADLEWL